MNRRERLEKALAMQKPDRMPFSLWMHFPNHDRSPRRLAEMALHNQRELDMDFVKYMPYGLFTCVDYGLPLKVFPGFFDAPVAECALINKPEDWTKLRARSGVEGEYAVVLESQRIFLKESKEQVPFLQTVFSPLTTAVKLCSGPDQLIEHIRKEPAKVHAALAHITETAVQFAKTAVDRGAAGLFMATQMSLKNQLTLAEHAEFVKKYDLAVLDAVKGKAWFTMYHMHGAHPWYEEFREYPVQAFNWHDCDDGPSLAEGRKLIPGKCFCGGLSHLKTAHQGTDAEIAAQVNNAWTSTEGKGVIFTPGCVLNTHTSMERLRHIAACVKATS